MTLSLTRRPSGLVPIAMSLAAVTTILLHIAVSGTAPQPDEGTAAHIWQLLMAGQLPVIAFFAVKWLPKDPRTALRVLALQAGAAFAALAPVYWLGW